ncbi:SurA N-terminal domain-containing protein [Gallaecimonas xiamenensis]|uniref:Periplasmic chaperone PpiD n=1 Tax=Gallaecimonas xiamenensis 3-C-1 TaxID=745411 RepID=K2JLR8_9GAMM|nr:SurA N-terminal domain-containing protein [Gallaecimonas xiamenensis]EKE76263.1 PpiC-type peptidyl-prolyl cis-trans isomerase [Gallaecimonas xiamenensis 3-C-1]
MMEQIREGSQSWIVKIILGLIILSFALTGVYSYLSGGPNGNAAAEVNGQSISRVELNRAYQNERARLESQNADMFSQLAGNEAFLNEIRRGALEQLINQHLMADAISEMGLRVSDEQVKAAIRDIPAFQIAGNFDNERYLAVLRNQGMSPSRFSEMMRADLARQQFVDGVLASAFVMPDEAKDLYAASRQSRDAMAVTVKASDFLATIEVSDEDIQARYDSEPQGYMAPEQVAVDYVELNADDLKAGVTVTDEQIQSYYQDNTNQFRRPEKRQASHILFTGDDAKAKAEAALKAIQGGKDFAEVAKTESTDTLSAEKGGDLGWIEPGVYKGDFDKALFAIAKEGDIAGPVESTYGYHLIKLTGIEMGTVKGLAEVKDSIKTLLVKKAADALFYEKQSKLEQDAFELPLAEAAKNIGVEVKHVPLFARSAPPAALSNGSVLDAVFSDSVKLDRRPSGLLEVGPEHIVALVASDYKEAHRKALDEVKGEIATAIRSERAKAKAEELAQALLDKLNAGEDVSGFLADNKLSEETLDALARNDTKAAPAIVRSAFDQQPGNAELVTLASGDSAVVKVKAVHPYQPTEQDQFIIQMWQQQLAKQRADAANRQFIDALRKVAEVKYLNLSNG